ncbi:MAG: nucleotidyltransferase substrate binding protein [Holosporales bacterium]|jgi:nucleotidyltransferase substrate binding protein (TIGR01987 family)
MDKTAPDVRWKQRFNNFQRAYQSLSKAIELANTRPLSELEQQGLIQSFEYTHELAWKVLKDYLEEQGFNGIIGSKNATRLAFKEGLLSNGEAWMDMIEARNQTSHTYDPDTAAHIAARISSVFYAELTLFAKQFSTRAGT